MYPISGEVYAHQIVNPPTAERGCNIDIIFAQSENNIILSKKGNAKHQTQYELKIEDPSTLKLSNSDNVSRCKLFEKLLLVFNLVLEHSALIAGEQNITEPEIKPKKGPAKTKVEDTPTGKKITVEDTVLHTDSVFITIGLTENISEDDVKSVYQLIEHLDNSSDQVKIENIKKSLFEYREAMNNFDGTSIFKHLFNSLELAINYDGKNRKGSSLDNEIAKIIETTIKITNKQEDSLTVLKEWRNFYGQAKHADKKISKIFKFRKIKVTHQLDPLRQSTQKVILEQLKNI